ncbi:MAG: universal stress protein [Candidatus Methanomethylophilaceae archaeon]|jgi:nucleotide-binding universal stress UspA family protein|nr:universal stress protein [Candidatus Methanomethylophilaceae archaeon]
MTILLAYDGKPNSEKALDYAIRHAVNYSEPLYILTVVSKDQMDPDDPDESVQEYMESAQRKASSGGATVHMMIEVGKPDETVIQVADLYKCDTIIVGRSGRSSLDRLFLGSVSNYVVKNADCTVIVVSDGEEED